MLSSSARGRNNHCEENATQEGREKAREESSGTRNQRKMVPKLQGVGDNYYLPNEDNTRKLYAKLEETLCLEEPRDNRNMEAQREMAANVLRAAGLDPDRMLREACVGARVEEQVAFLTKTMVGVMQGNGTNTVEKIRAMIADAITYAKKVTETAH